MRLLHIRNRYNTNRRNKVIIRIYQEYKALGLKDTTIFERHIKDKFFISLSTFRNILGKRLNHEQKNIDQQLNLFKKNKA